MMIGPAPMIRMLSMSVRFGISEKSTCDRINRIAQDGQDEELQDNPVNPASSSC
jgi:hypothetical protein